MTNQEIRDKTAKLLREMRKIEPGLILRRQKKEVSVMCDNGQDSRTVCLEFTKLDRQLTEWLLDGAPEGSYIVVNDVTDYDGYITPYACVMYEEFEDDESYYQSVLRGYDSVIGFSNVRKLQEKCKELGISGVTEYQADMILHFAQNIDRKEPHGE